MYALLKSPFYPYSLDEYSKSLEAFKKRDSPVLNMDEMKTNVETLTWLGNELASAKQELFVSTGSGLLTALWKLDGDFEVFVGGCGHSDCELVCWFVLFYGGLRDRKLLSWTFKNQNEQSFVSHARAAIQYKSYE